jgi:hypothetical protein
LTDTQREELMTALNRDGFVVLPGLLPDALRREALESIDRLAAEARAADPARRSVKIANIVDVAPCFRALAMYEPALQLAYDCFGPMFHLCQSNLVSRPRDEVVNDFIGSSPWHADGPRPGIFPKINGVMGLHYLKFGYFLTDLTHGNGGSLQVIRGSHLIPELKWGVDEFRLEDYASDFVQIDCPPGTVARGAAESFRYRAQELLRQLLPDVDAAARPHLPSRRLAPERNARGTLAPERGYSFPGRGAQCLPLVASRRRGHIADEPLFPRRRPEQGDQSGEVRLRPGAIQPVDGFEAEAGALGGGDGGETLKPAPNVGMALSGMPVMPPCWSARANALSTGYWGLVGSGAFCRLVISMSWRSMVKST